MTDSTQPQPLTAEGRLRDAIAGERADWHRVEVDPRDIAAVLREPQRIHMALVEVALERLASATTAPDPEP